MKNGLIFGLVFLLSVSSAFAMAQVILPSGSSGGGSGVTGITNFSDATLKSLNTSLIIINGTRTSIYDPGAATTVQALINTVFGGSGTYWTKGGGWGNYNGIFAQKNAAGATGLSQPASYFFYGAGSLQTNTIYKLKYNISHSNNIGQLLVQFCGYQFQNQSLMNGTYTIVTRCSNPSASLIFQPKDTNSRFNLSQPSLTDAGGDLSLGGSLTSQGIVVNWGSGNIFSANSAGITGNAEFYQNSNAYFNGQTSFSGWWADPDGKIYDGVDSIPWAWPANGFLFGWEGWQSVSSFNRQLLDQNGNPVMYWAYSDQPYGNSVVNIQGGLAVSGNANFDYNQIYSDGSGNFYVNGKMTSYGGYDPPYIMLDKTTQFQTLQRIKYEVPISKLGGLALWWNGTTLMGVSSPDNVSANIYTFQITLLRTVALPVANTTYSTSYYFDPIDGQAHKSEAVTSTKWQINKNYFLNSTDGNFYKTITNSNKILNTTTNKTQIITTTTYQLATRAQATSKVN